MAEKMVRTQVYLPRPIYDKLRQRARKHELTLAFQIRAALEDYLGRVEAEEDDGVLRADDPIFKMIGLYSSGVTDASVNHDYYLYGAPKREPDEARPIKVVREKRVARYPPKSKRPTRKRSTK